MSEPMMLAAAFLAVATPLFVAVGIVGADRVREQRHTALVRRSA